jgi:hypothetical protein
MYIKQLEVASRVENRLIEEIDAFLALGDALIEAKQTLDDREFRALVRGTGLRTPSRAATYMNVAARSVMRDPQIRPHLPNSIGCWMGLVKWSDDEIRDAVASGIMKPNAVYAQLLNWVDERRGLQRSSARESQNLSIN